MHKPMQALMMIVHYTYYNFKLLFVIVHYFFLNALRNRLIPVKEHGICSAALRLGTKISGISEHVSQRHKAVDLLDSVDLFHAVDTAASAVDIADDISHVFSRRSDLDLHNGFKKHTAGLLHGILTSHGARNLECHLRRVDLMVRTIDKRGFHAKNGESGKNAGLAGFTYASVNCGDVFLRNNASNDLILEFVGRLGVGVKRLETNLAVTVLAMAARLLDILAVDLDA